MRCDISAWLYYYRVSIKLLTLRLKYSAYGDCTIREYSYNIPVTCRLWNEGNSPTVSLPRYAVPEWHGKFGIFNHNHWTSYLRSLASSSSVCELPHSPRSFKPPKFIYTTVATRCKIRGFTMSGHKLPVLIHAYIYIWNSQWPGHCRQLRDNWF